MCSLKCFANYRLALFHSAPPRQFLLVDPPSNGSGPPRPVKIYVFEWVHSHHHVELTERSAQESSHQTMFAHL